MKTIYNYFLNKKNTVLICTVMPLILFSGCKKNDNEVNSSFIESKLITGTAEHWVAPINLSKDVCGGSTVTLALDSDHNFTYMDGSCSFAGTWNADYVANRSGQFLNLNLTYTYNSSNYQESFSLKYSSEQDIFYALDQNTLELLPFEKYNLAP
ncbi:MAG: hypothetical protein JWM14_1555 [Chitinophagaceae bacterium]|nr:hypothetical protein [Chitinophagaceae bacterium]